MGLTVGGSGVTPLFAVRREGNGAVEGTDGLVTRLAELST